MSPHPNPKPTRRIARNALLAVGAVFFIFASTTALATNDNQGTVKVHNPDEIGDESTDPMVGCQFYVEGFNMEATSGTLVIQSWPPTGNNKTTVYVAAWIADDNETTGHHFINGPLELSDGHYKLFASDVKHDKTKTFWVECVPPCEVDCTPPCEVDCTPPCEVDCTPPCEVDCTPPCEVDCTPPCEVDCTPPCDVDCTPTTEVPVFPSATAALLGAVGAIGGSVLLLRRKR